MILLLLLLLLLIWLQRGHNFTKKRGRHLQFVMAIGHWTILNKKQVSLVWHYRVFSAIFCDLDIFILHCVQT